MIFGSLENLDQEEIGLSLVLQRGLQYLKTTDLCKLPIGRHDIEGDDMFASVSEYEVESRETKYPEAHRRYIDIQCIAWGEELIGYGLLTDQYEVERDELVEKDVIFYKQVTQEMNIVLTPGHYAIFFPNDVHRPGCINKDRHKVKKVVIKIAVALLR